MMIRAHVCQLLLLVAYSVTAQAQSDTLTVPFWMERDLRYWRGLPMTGGPNGECIAGYTEEESLLRFYPDGRFQEIGFELRYSTRIFFSMDGDPCGILTGDSISMQDGDWTLVDDTLRVVVDYTGLYARQPFLNEFVMRQEDGPFRPSVPPTRLCTMPRERWMWIGDAVLEEQDRTWR